MFQRPYISNQVKGDYVLSSSGNAVAPVSCLPKLKKEEVEFILNPQINIEEKINKIISNSELEVKLHYLKQIGAYRDGLETVIVPARKLQACSLHTVLEGVWQKKHNEKEEQKRRYVERRGSVPTVLKETDYIREGFAPLPKKCLPTLNESQIDWLFGKGPDDDAKIRMLEENPALLGCLFAVKIFGACKRENEEILDEVSNTSYDFSISSLLEKYYAKNMNKAKEKTNKLGDSFDMFNSSSLAGKGLNKGKEKED